MTTPKQKSQSQILPSLDNYPAKTLSYQLIPSRHISDQRTLQSDWARDILATSNQKWYSQTLSSPDDHLQAKELKYQLTLLISGSSKIPPI